MDSTEGARSYGSHWMRPSAAGSVSWKGSWTRLRLPRTERADQGRSGQASQRSQGCMPLKDGAELGVREGQV